VRQKTPTFRRQITADLLSAPVAKAVDILAGHLSEPVAMETVAIEAGISPRQLERLFKKETGQSPSRYYRMLRMKAARQLVLFTKEAMPRIAVGVGYETVPPLVRHYREEFGVTPIEDRQNINRFRVEDNRPLPLA
jgi:AraC family transcriptional regulator, glycine betaine-responsive activator